MRELHNSRLPAGEPHATVRSGHRVALRTLSITRKDHQYLVGDLARGEFIEVPAIAITVINALGSGRTVAETAALASREAGQDVDVARFVGTLIDCGFVAAVDDVPLPVSGPELTYGGAVGAVVARLGKPLYSAAAWACYGLLFAGCLIVLTTVHWFRPCYGQLFFLPNPVLSIAVLTVATLPFTIMHELAHWLGARVAGVPARISVSRRYYLLVLQTDLSAIWALPRNRRFGPLLAGMALDTVITAGLIGMRVTQFLGWWEPPQIFARLLAAMVLIQIFGISFQFVLFLRTDLYGVLITALGRVNLTRISRLRMAQIYRSLNAAETLELASASERDQAVSRWYGCVQLGGALVATWYFVAFFAPSVLLTVHWIGSGLSHSSPASLKFWYVAASGCVAILPALIPPLAYLRNQARTRHCTSSRQSRRRTA